MPGLIVLVQNNQQLFDRNRDVIRQMAQLISHEPFYRSNFMEAAEFGLHACRVYLDHDYAGDVVGSNHDGTVQCMLSGELFGLNQLLSNLGDRRTAVRDPKNYSEIVACLYEIHGDAVLGMLNGYFNLLVVDRRDNSLLVANDRLGLQRFYHSNLPEGGIMFAPEIKCFRLMPSLNLSLDERAVIHAFRYDCVLNNASFYREVKRLPVATARHFHLGGWKTSQYWSPANKLEKVEITPQQFIDDTVAVFESVVGDYYTPGMTALSLTGGLDTRAILSVLTRQEITLPLFTFGGMYGDSYDVKIARKLAKMSGNRFDVIRLDGRFLDDFRKWAEKAIYISDGIARLNTCHEYYLNLLVRDYGKVRLTGKYGSQIIRMATMIRDRSPDLAIFSHDFKKRFLDETHYVSVNGRTEIIQQELPQLWGAYHAQEAAALTVRSPYTDNRLVDVMLRAPQMADTSLLQKQIYSKNAPHLARIPTNRGDRPTNGLNLTKWYYRGLNFVDSVYNWERLPRWALPVCCFGDLSGVSRFFVGRSEWTHYRRWFMGELREFAESLILDPQTRRREFYNGNSLERMIKLHFAGKANHTAEIIKIGSFEIWCRQNKI